MEKDGIYKSVLMGIIRHIISGLSGILVAHGFITYELGSKFTDTVTLDVSSALILFATSIWFSYKDKIWEFLKTRIAILLPPTATMKRVEEVAKTVENKTAIATGKEALPTYTLKPENK